MWKFFKIGAVFFKNSTVFLTQIIFCIIIPKIKQYSGKIFILSVFALNGSCRNRAVQIPDFAYRNRQNQKEERVDSPQMSDTLGFSHAPNRCRAKQVCVFSEEERHAAT